MESARVFVPLVALLAGAGLLVAGLLLWPTEQRGYVSPHPWADYITSGAVVEAAGVFEIIRRPLRARGLGAAKLTMLAVGLAVVVAIAFLAIASIVHVLR